MKWLEQLHKTWPLPDESKHQRILVEQLYHNTLAIHRIMLPLITISQILMLISMSMRPGGLWASWRRSSYGVSYMLLLATTLVMLVIDLWYGHQKSPNLKTYRWLNTLYGALFCLWGCAVSLLDQLGSNGLTVYIYVLLIVAVLGNLPPLAAIFIFSGSFVLLNTLLPYFPWPSGLDQSFSNFSNSLFISLFAIIIATLIYRQRMSGYYKQLIINEQYEQIRIINAQLEQDIVIDTLTGLYNRRYLEQLADGFDKLRDEELQVAMLLIDIDYFKRYNDRFGHQAGDNCLRKTAEAIQQSLADTNAQAIRYGGEEFAVFLTGADAQRAFELAEKLCADIYTCQLLPAGETGQPVTISIGVCIRNSAQVAVLNTLIAQADLALYQAKANGRNQAALCPTPAY